MVPQKSRAEQVVFELIVFWMVVGWFVAGVWLTVNAVLRPIGRGRQLGGEPPPAP
jgi:hypothetical protein